MDSPLRALRRLLSATRSQDPLSELKTSRASEAGSQGSKEREHEELITVMSAISDAILAVNREGELLFFNSRFALLFGGADIARRRLRLREIFRYPSLLDAFRATLAEGVGKQVSFQMRFGGEAEPRYFSVSWTPLKKESGETYGAVGVFHDVTELKRAEKVRIDFVANVSHELRTPLTSIKGYADTLLADVRAGNYESTGKFLETIVRNTDRLMMLVDDLLDLSRLEASETSGKLQRTELDVRDLTARVIAQLEVKARDRGQKIETSFEVERVHADSSRVEQVLINLVENAIKYVPGGGKIEIRWKPVDSGVALVVRDNGPGIPPKHLDRLFERFYRIDEGRARESGGTGLGLAIVKHIMQSHGGSVRVSSRPGQGTEFICEFPDSGR